MEGLCLLAVSWTPPTCPAPAGPSPSSLGVQPAALPSPSSTLLPPALPLSLLSPASPSFPTPPPPRESWLFPCELPGSPNTLSYVG